MKYPCEWCKGQGEVKYNYGGYYDCKPCNKTGFKEITVNTLCQSCRSRPRSKVIYTWSGAPQIWLLCDECTKPGSKYHPEHESNKDLTANDPETLKQTFIRDVTHPYHKFSFFFKLICIDDSLGDDYLFVPGLWSGHNECKVWNITKQKEDNGWWDWPIILYESPFKPNKKWKKWDSTKQSTKKTTSGSRPKKVDATVQN